MLRHLSAALFCLVLAVLNFMPNGAQADDKITAYQKKFLFVDPAEGWTREILTEDLFNTCVAYDKKGTTLSVLGCPGSSDDDTFKSNLEEAKEEGGYYIGTTFVQTSNEGTTLFIPTSKDDGAIFIVMDDGPAPGKTADSIYAAARPMLDRFSKFKFPMTLKK